MSPEDRWTSIISELIDIANLKVTPGDPAAREQALFIELAELEGRYGEQFDRQERARFD